MLGIIAPLCLFGVQIDELLLAVYVELAVDVAGVVLHGVVRDGELFLDMLGVVAAGEQGEHLPLALGEACLLGYLLATCIEAIDVAHFHRGGVGFEAVDGRVETC